MKVLVVTTSYPDRPGAQRGIFIRELCRALTGKGAEVMVVTPRVDPSSPLRENDQGIEVRRFTYPTGGRRLHQTESIPVFPMAVFMVSGLASTLRAVRSFRPDVIHGNWIVPTGLIASIAGLSSLTPVVNTARGMDTRLRKNPAVRPLFDLAVRLSGRVTVVSEAMRAIPGLEAAEVIPSGIKDQFFEVSPDPSSQTVLYTRSLEPVYGADTIIRSIPHVLEKAPGARFVIAGTGSLAGHLEAMASELGVRDRVTFLGHVPHESVPALLSESRVFVSTATEDGTSVALMEAMAAGLIPVATDIAPNRTLIEHETDGFLFRPKDAPGLALMITRALSGEIREEAIASKRADLKRRIPWSVVADRFVLGYNQLLERSRR
ncbi:MAG TPA: glycosyltransferase [Deltaproteobacteria bacterium]|nr:glycosyltransferase [Deltaproteobacteria bacterium]HPP81176.1 glycosyltransferase [Deltaproteobacteria bacterium]